MNRATVPFLKWPGGKRWLVPYLHEYVREYMFQRYVEPFLGGGAMFFGLHAANAILSDLNADLINTYIQVRAHPLELERRLQLLPVDKTTYNTVREADPSDELERAIRFLYLNRTAFGGMYRLNRQGHFNVPFGGGQRDAAPLWKNNLLVRASQALSEAHIVSSDFEPMLAQTGAGDLVYCDPTYTVAHNQNGFVRYNEKNFSWRDQERLAISCREAAARGATVLVSNAFHSDVVDLYPSAEFRVLERKSLICPDKSKRRSTQEYVIILRGWRAS